MIRIVIYSGAKLGDLKCFFTKLGSTFKAHFRLLKLRSNVYYIIW